MRLLLLLFLVLHPDTVIRHFNPPAGASISERERKRERERERERERQRETDRQTDRESERESVIMKDIEKRNK